ncbi:4839_t:CDS:2 [Scutellospora calospora]|uniref:4839_t:CDS:1 n=1 Tax=Scutellospora calospora TaxID=85575 RepID=A0ACA9LTN6_9GLOM|nr:4839_t:CDS:2 [Scutellospora calospora]
MTKRKQNNNSTSSDIETNFRNLSNPKSGRPLTGVWKYFERDAPKAYLANSYKNIPEK